MFGFFRRGITLTHHDLDVADGKKSKKERWRYLCILDKGILGGRLVIGYCKISQVCNLVVVLEFVLLSV